MIDNSKDSVKAFLARVLTYGDTSKAITSQESHGQAQFVNAGVLPCRTAGRGSFELLKAQLEIMGIKVGALIDEDDGALFMNVVLPDGWKIQADKHPMWSRLIDDKGRERALMFYKAAFYDRSAHITLSRRFHYKCEPVGGWEKYNYEREPWHGVVADGSVIVWRTEAITCNRNDYDVQTEMEAQAKAWLTEHYPDYNDPMAYWDETP